MHNSSQEGGKEITVSGLRFLGEQDGPPERLVKHRLTDLFSMDPNILRAYFARVTFVGTDEVSVALGLRTQSGPDTEIVKTVGIVFGSVFNAREHLDIVFLSDGQEAELKKVCKPFFKR